MESLLGKKTSPKSPMLKFINFQGFLLAVSIEKEKKS